MAQSIIKQSYPFKTFQITGITNSAGTFGMVQTDLPSDCNYIIGIYNTNNGNYYIVQYNNLIYGVFKYDHTPLQNQSISITFIYA